MTIYLHSKIVLDSLLHYLDLDLPAKTFCQKGNLGSASIISAQMLTQLLEEHVHIQVRMGKGEVAFQMQHSSSLVSIASGVG